MQEMNKMEYLLQPDKHLLPNESPFSFSSLNIWDKTDESVYFSFFQP